MSEPVAMTNEQLESAIASKAGEKVTTEYMTSRIKESYFFHPNPVAPTLTICVIILDNGFISIGEAACVDPSNYDKTIGENLAYRNAFQKLWPLFGFLLAEKRYVEAVENLRANTHAIDIAGLQYGNQRSLEK
jgi:hypothetical protein